MTETGIHPSAIISPKAKLGAAVSIGPFTIVGPGVELGDGCVVGSHCELGVATADGSQEPLVIGAGGLIRSHSIFYSGSTFGSNLRTGHRVTVRERVTAGLSLQIGTLSDIQGHCSIGDYVRTHSNVHIGQKSVVGNYVWIFPYVVLTNDPHPPSNSIIGATLEDFSAVATMAVVLPGVTIGKGALVAAGAIVGKDLAPHRIAAGNPAKDIGETSRIRRRDGSGEPAYPWPAHFRRGYPETALADFDAFLADYHNSKPVPEVKR